MPTTTSLLAFLAQGLRVAASFNPFYGVQSMAMDLVPPFGACVNQLGVGLKNKENSDQDR